MVFNILRYSLGYEVFIRPCFEWDTVTDVCSGLLQCCKSYLHRYKLHLLGFLSDSNVWKDDFLHSSLDIFPYYNR